MHTRVKICGITRHADALTAIQYGADAIGLVFYAPSPRYVNIEQASEIISGLPPFVTKVGLFVNANAHEIEAILSNVKLDMLQFHGDEPPEACDRFQLAYLKAIRVKADTNLVQYAQQYNTASALLLDTYSDSAFGGTGQVFDWRLIPQDLPKPVILAGGLTAENVGSAIAQIAPYAVDVSGGVELSKGIKDTAKIVAFMQAVQQARSNNAVI